MMGTGGGRERLVEREGGGKDRERNIQEKQRETDNNRKTRLECLLPIMVLRERSEMCFWFGANGVPQKATGE